MSKDNKQLKILMLTHLYSNTFPGGETRAAWEFTQELAEEGLKIYVVTTTAKIENVKLHKNIKVYRIPFSTQSRNFSKLDAFKTFFYSLPIILFKRIDIIHLINTQSPHPFAYFKIRPYVSTVDLHWKYEDKRFNNDLMYDRKLKKEEFGLDEQKMNLFDRVLNRLTVYFFKWFKMGEPLPKTVDLCAYRHTKLLEGLQQTNPESRKVHIPVGAHTNKFKPQDMQERHSSKDTVFFFAGTIAKRKGVEFLVEAFNLLNEENEDVKLLLAGPGAPQTVEFIKNLIKNKDNVKLLGQLSADELIHYYNLADVFVAPSIGIDLGINRVVIEAMSCGTPVIINKAHDSLPLDGKTGYCVDGGDVVGIKEAMEKFIKDKNLIKEMGDNAREFVLENHGWGILAKRLKKSYIDLLKNP